MKTTIYYFTGTGNSLAAARKIAGALGETELVPIASLADTPGIISPAADRVGIVCPVYDCGVPVMVANFAERLDLSKARYAFAVVTMGGMGVSALHQLNGIFIKQQNRKLDAAFAVSMPGNFPPLMRSVPAERCGKTLSKADKRLGDIAEAIGSGRLVSPGFAPLSGLVKALSYGSLAKSAHDAGELFSVSDACTGCGTCAAICPAGNLTLVDGRPAWGRKCEICCACLHFCPTEAIQLNVMLGTEGRGRYRHPDLTVADMVSQRGE
ncbi:4Fe-4S binding protein [Methanoculleus sp. YWC-01]|jgi:ferredoxin|uniref:4Fe-4S binding protein n=1 Tax=Methanoculleus nereidis TaxID=2735141 RepID=A0ABU3Z5V0_9EURY|nr:EFR1 family ferrodoxin [Methanoculleus sp. YWC-01]MCK9297552.1 EFR1 family ferrodoxin [Methanoculleus sp.]MDV4343989.1 4Fe-4S binding protein [Methanoculleus sp. YWC-01]